MLDRKITFGGEEIPAGVANTPAIIRPARKMTTTVIAGTNREIVEMEDAWESYDQEYDFFVGDGSKDSVQPMIDVVAQVINKTGWQVLLDDYEPNYYRLAYLKDGFEVKNKRTRVGTFSLTFRCRPERFLIEGNTEYSIASGSSIFNPTAFNAKPLIHITGSGNGSITIGSTTFTITGMTDYLNIDCDKMDVYRLPSENRNSLMTGEFPKLASGDNIVSFTGGIQTVKITPRWWTI